MFDRTDIRAAVEAGAISDEGAKRFEAFLKARNDPDRMLDPENLRFLSNFNDVFLTIGIVILMTGVGFLSALSFVNIFGLSNGPAAFTDVQPFVDGVRATIVLSAIVVIAVAWLLAEYFCGRRRLLLPSMALATNIAWAAGILAVGVFAPANNIDRAETPWDIIAPVSYAGFGAAAIAAGAIFWRFRLPFSLFLLAGSIAGLFYTAVAQMSGGTELVSGATMLLAGVVTLGAAIAFDMRDPTRSTRNSDHAFWLHLAAAPQIILGVRAVVIGSGFAPAGVTDAVVMLLVLLAFSFLSLALNRRALIVSGLVTFGSSLFVLVNELGGGGVNTVMYVALIIGAAIVLLGGGWRTARRAILKVFPQEGTMGRIFPPEPA